MNDIQGIFDRLLGRSRALLVVLYDKKAREVCRAGQADESEQNWLRSYVEDLRKLSPGNFGEALRSSAFPVPSSGFQLKGRTKSVFFSAGEYGMGALFNEMTTSGGLVRIRMSEAAKELGIMPSIGGLDD